MKLRYLVGAAFIAGCSSTTPSNPPVDAAMGDGPVSDAVASDSPTGDATETGTGDAGDAGVSETGASTDASTDAMADVVESDVVTLDVSCSEPALPSSDPFTITSGDAGDASAEAVILHATAAGTQDYTCEVSTADSGPPYLWTFVGPEAVLRNCMGTVVAQHFASEAGAGFPEWMAPDGTYVIGQKAQAYTPDGGSGSVPWLLLNAVTTGGGDAGLSGTQHIERLNTDGGVAPSMTTCTVDAGGTTQKVPYTADYYFLTP
jgi:hypothetical protein